MAFMSRLRLIRTELGKLSEHPVLGFGRNERCYARHKETAYKAMDEVTWAHRLKAVNTTSFGMVCCMVQIPMLTGFWNRCERPAVTVGGQTLGRPSFWELVELRVIVAGLQDQGATDIFVANRTVARAKALQDELAIRSEV